MRVTGPVVRLQGDETQTVGAVLACATLHRARTGDVPPTLDSLLAFAKTVWLARAPADDGPDGCSSRWFPRRAIGSATAQGGGWIHESRRFVVRYARTDDGVRITLRPLRYGETGVVSLLQDDVAAGGMRLTLENREPSLADPVLVPGATAAERWRLRGPD